MNSLKYSILFTIIAILASCINPAENIERPGPKYRLTVNTDPAEGGIADPNSGEFEEGTEITITAIPNEGWKFSEWSNDISSIDNPVTFAVNEDTEITANFVQEAKAFTEKMMLSDGVNSTELTFGLNEGASPGFDQNLDQEAPPLPPEGAFYAQFAIENARLIKDFRPITEDQTIWYVEFSPENGRNITISWDISSDQIAGTLSLVDNLENPSLEIDMISVNEYKLTETTKEELFLIYSAN